ncbi:MAG: methyltransferase domain-containing protein [Lachnospiraceae bacterium]|nr:methyltransferase domain-containing protein [Lachnospiraceae bacterium]
MNNITVFNRAINWIRQNTIDGNGITTTSKKKIIYPEVTGYYIPTLLEWGERELAISYAKYLCSIQKEDGSWYDSYDKEPYVFDTAQILKGLLSIRDILPEVDAHIEKGCDWLLHNVDDAGRLTTPSKDAWGKDESFCSELIHIYCLTPLVKASGVLNISRYRETAYRILEYYKSNYYDKIVNFSLLSHFYAYVMEGLVDLGEVELAAKAMEKLEKVQNRKGGIPGLHDVKWVCSTGCFQIALVWYKLGELERGNKLFRYACNLQNKSGGWFGSYPGTFFNRFSKDRQKAYYFPDEEISWANKYFLDALHYKMQLEVEEWSDSFSDNISMSDGRYNVIKNELLDMKNNRASSGALEICDVGCGKGRYVKNLLEEFPDHKYYATDLSKKVMENLPEAINKQQGNLTQLPYTDEAFDCVYTVEALEHAVNIHGALSELWRVVKPNGRIIIIDKPVEQLGKLEIEEWEQWIDSSQIQKFVDEHGGKLRIISSVGYKNRDDGLFRGWIITKA